MTEGCDENGNATFFNFDSVINATNDGILDAASDPLITGQKVIMFVER